MINNYRILMKRNKMQIIFKCLNKMNKLNLPLKLKIQKISLLNKTVIIKIMIKKKSKI